jgi:hypothetical protein
VKQTIKFYVISDSIGETAERVVFATLRQFPNLNTEDIKKFPFINNEEDLRDILKDALVEQAVVITTLVDEGLNQLVRDFVAENNLEHVDYLSTLMNIVSNKTGETPILKSGALHSLDEEYFNRMAAIEFAVKYDDGKSPKGFLQSDIVLLGISRTSKTPLSMYLANKSYKVSNLPLIPEVQLAPEIMEVPSKKIFGLIASPRYIMQVRSERMRMMGLNSTTSYNNIERIKGELSYAEELFEKLGANVINVENRSIEETAQLIEEMLNNY